MRTLFFVAALLAGLFGGYWFVVASQIEERTEVALADLEARGWEVDYATLATTGFPSRFDTLLTDLRIASPDGGVVWEAPSFRVEAPSYRPNRLVAAWPEAQALVVAGRRLDIAARDLTASATFGLSPDLPLGQATLGSGLAAIAAGGSLGIGLDGLAATAQRTGSDPAAYDVVVEAEGLRPATVSASIGLLRLDAQVRLGAPVELRNGATPRFESLALRELRLAQGDVALTGTGNLAPDAQGYLAGTVTLAAENWRGLLDLLEAAGVLVHEQRPFLERALEELARGSDRIEVPITFADGQVQALGVPLTKAPRVL